VRAVPRLCEFYPGIYLTTEEKAQKNLSQVKKNLSQVKKKLSQVKKNVSQVKKNLSQVKKNLSQSTVYILPKHPHITKPTQTHTHTFSTTAIEGVRGQRHVPAALTPRRTWYPLYRRLGIPLGRFGQVRKISPPLGFDPPTVQREASRYTDWATRPTSPSVLNYKWLFLGETSQLCFNINM